MDDMSRATKYQYSPLSDASAEVRILKVDLDIKGIMRGKNRAVKQLHRTRLTAEMAELLNKFFILNDLHRLFKHCNHQYLLE